MTDDRSPGPLAGAQVASPEAGSSWEGRYAVIRIR